MKVTFVAIMLTMMSSTTVLLPEASALTPRTDFNDNHFTYHTFSTIRI
ncbi:MAG TPA: hypothetical protein VEJ68_06280 [Candidatus Bathyarchaeia archaeon]|nr:hypothetical protein [Candidatus Bathyarchaeia archaeon]